MGVCELKRLLIALLVISIIMAPLLIITPGFAEEISKEPIIHLNFEDSYEDVTVNNHDGTKYGKVTFTEGIIGKGAQFSGGYIDLSETKDINFDNGMTLSVWVKLDTDDYKISWPILYKQGPEEGWPAMVYHIGYGGTVFQSSLGFGEDYWNYTFDFIGNDPIESAQLVEKWAHIVSVYNGEDVKVYIDGELYDSQFIPSEITEYTTELTKSSRPLQIGKSEEEDFKGYMDELKIFDYSLSEDEILGLFNEVNTQYNGEIELKLEDPYIYVNGEKKQIDPQNIDITPIVIEGRTLVPIRAIIEGIGGTIGWDQTERRVDISYKSNIIKLWLDNKNGEVNGESKQLDVPPMSINNRTMMPVRFVSENLGMKVEWNQSTRTIVLKYIK